jgi:hypothetical protein
MCHLCVATIHQLCHPLCDLNCGASSQHAVYALGSLLLANLVKGFTIPILTSFRRWRSTGAYSRCTGSIAWWVPHQCTPNWTAAMSALLMCLGLRLGAASQALGSKPPRAELLVPGVQGLVGHFQLMGWCWASMVPSKKEPSQGLACGTRLRSHSPSLHSWR